MDAKGTGNSINELSCATIAEELIHSPFHSYHSLNGVSRSNLKDTTFCEVKLEDILNTNESVLATVSARNWSISFLSLIPLIHVNTFAIFEDLSRLSTWVSDSNNHFKTVVVGLKHILLLLWWSTSVDNVIGSTSRGIHNNWEARESDLTLIETIPYMVHETINLIVHIGTLQPRVYWLNRSIHCIIIFTFKSEHTKIILRASP